MENQITVIQESELTEAEDRYPSRMVLRRVKPGTFATHIEVFPPEAKPYFILGRYFFSLSEAEADFNKRRLELDGP